MEKFCSFLAPRGVCSEAGLTMVGNEKKRNDSVEKSDGQQIHLVNLLK